VYNEPTCDEIPYITTIIFCGLLKFVTKGFQFEYLCQVSRGTLQNLLFKSVSFLFTFPIGKVLLSWKKSMLRFWRILVLRSQESEKGYLKNCRVFSVLCTVYSVTVAGDERSTSGIKMKLWIWDKTRTEMRFLGSCVMRGTMEYCVLGDVLAYL